MSLRQTLKGNVNKKRVFLMGTSVILAASLLVAGTLAWTSFSQTAKNPRLDTGVPGGRIHDDFDGDNKDVYAENYGTEPIVVRIRLDEYLEYGTGAGLVAGDTGFEDKDVTIVTIDSEGDPSNIEDVATWQTHIPTDGDINISLPNDDVHEYFSWELGGSKIYMPTFNKDIDSQSSDVTGIGVDGETGTANTAPGRNPGTNDNDGSQDYWQDGDKLTYDASYGDTVEEEEHTAQSTIIGTVITMKEWEDNGRPKGTFWVYDRDGWAYWAQALEPDTATGLLLDEIIQVLVSRTPQYYVINVVGQFASIGDYSEFYAAANGSPVMPGSSAEYLLLQNGDLLPNVTGVSIKPDTAQEFFIGITNLAGGIDFNATVTGENLNSGKGDTAVTWKIEGPDISTVTFDTTTGVLSNATAVGIYTITATSKDDTNVFDSIQVEVKSSTEQNIAPYNVFGIDSQSDYPMNEKVIYYEHPIILGNYAYTFGGYNASDQFHKKSYRYNLSTGEVTSIADFPNNAADVYPVAIGDKIYLIGGYNNNGDNIASADVYEYDPATNSYAVKVSDNNILHKHIANGVVGYYGNYIYAIGGAQSQTTAWGTPTDEIIRIDINTWQVETIAAKAPIAAGRQGGVQVGNILYVGGGHNGSATNLVKNFFKLDMSDGTVTSLANLPDAHCYTRLAWYETMDKIVLFGSSGINQNGYIYDEESDSWTRCTDFDGYFGNGSSSGITQNGNLLFGVNGNQISAIALEDEQTPITVNQGDAFMIKAKTTTDKAAASIDGSITYNPGDVIPADVVIKVLSDDTKIYLAENLTLTGSWVRRVG